VWKSPNPYSKCSLLRLPYLLNIHQVTSVPSSIPPLRSAIHHLLSIRDHPAQVPFTFGMQPRMPVIGSVSDDPVVLLLQDPCEIGPVVVSIYRSISDEAVDQDRGFVILKCEG
jgi:hypothetical protein